jgi:hypothetical protein
MFNKEEMMESENQFGRAISNSEIVLSDVPPPDADWCQITEFALTFDGYEHHGSTDKCAVIANARQDGTLSEQRRYHHFGESPNDKTMAYIRTVIEKIRQKVLSNQLE